MTAESNPQRDWERTVAVAVSVTLLVTLVVGLVLAIIGVLVPGTFLVIAVPLVILAWIVFRPRTFVISRQRRSALALGIVGFVVLAVTVLNITSTAEHLQTNRDPGVYVTTGKWLASHGTLLVDGAVSGFDGIENITGRTGGYHDPRDDGLLYPQFNHGFAVTLALSNWIGGDRLMLNLNPLFGAAFLLFLFVYLRRFFVDWIALIAVGTAALNLVFWHFARDAYSEPLVALLLVLALLAADDAVRFGGTRRWMLAGLLVGAGALVRIDAWFYIAIFSGIIAIHSWMRGTAIARFRTRDALAALGGAWGVGVIGFADLVLRSPQYLADLWPNVRLMLMAAAVGGLMALIAVFIVVRYPMVVESSRAAWDRTERILRLAGALGIVVFAAWALVWRPTYNPALGSHPGLVTGLMAQEGVLADPARSFYELSARWLTWYWGVIGIVVAVAGWALAVGKRHLADRPRLYLPLTLAGLALIPYIIDPSISPDQIWALRRFFPMGLLGIAIAVALPLSLLAQWTKSHDGQQWSKPVLGVVAMIALVAVPGLYAAPLATASTQVGMYGSTVRLCEELPADAAVLVEAGRLATVYPAAIRSFCDVPVASLKAEGDRADIDAAAALWEEQGRSLHVLGTPDACFINGEGMATSEFTYTFPERTLTFRPAESTSGEFGWKLAPWDDPGNLEVSDTAWEIEVRTDWTPSDSSSVIASEGVMPGARWWLEYRQTGLVEFWVNTESGPVGVAYLRRLDDNMLKTIPFGFDNEEIYIGCGGNRRSALAGGIVAKSGSIEIGQVVDGALRRSRFIGEAEVRIDGSG
jgi:hypothetical protein